MGKHTSGPEWLEIRRTVEAGGFSLQEVADKFGVTYSAVRKRAQRERWITPKRINKALSRKVSHIPLESVISDDLAEMGQAFRRKALKISLSNLSQLDIAPPEVRTWQDAKALVDIGAKMAGLDSQQGPAVNILVQSDGITLSESTS